MRVGIDVGGTFTDLFAYDESKGEVRITKVLSTPPDYFRGCINAINTAGIDVRKVTKFIGHASTVAENALIERRLARVALITTAGFEDLIFMGRLHRQRLYDLQWDRPSEFRPLVRRRDVFGIEERVGGDGEIILPLDVNQAERLASRIIELGYESLAIFFLNSYKNAAHEKALRDVIIRIAKQMGANIEVSVSSELVRIIRELPRLSTTLIDAAIKPIMKRYLSSLKEELRRLGFGGQILVTQSNGGVGSLDSISERAVYAVASGAAAGVIASKFVSELYGLEDAISYDMGGTTCKVSAIVSGRYQVTTEFQFEWDLPIAVPMIDMVEIGNGGGSIAWVDRGGMLRVGPRSAGAVPGPACYGLGGVEPTLTDANLLLGRLGKNTLLGGTLRVSYDGAFSAIKKIGDELNTDPITAALSIVSLSELNMAHALRRVTIARGIDPTRFVMVAFGGAGPMHACNVAKELGVKTVLIPQFPGVFAAFGMVSTDLVQERIASVIRIIDEIDLNELNTLVEQLIKEISAELSPIETSSEPAFFIQFKVKYSGESFGKELVVDVGSKSFVSKSDLEEVRRKFEEMHLARYGFIAKEDPIVVTDVIVKGAVSLERPKLKRYEVVKDVGKPPVKERREVVFEDENGVVTPVYDRDAIPPGSSLEGPCIIEEYSSTIVIPPGFNAYFDEYRNVWARVVA